MRCRTAALTFALLLPIAIGVPTVASAEASRPPKRLPLVHVTDVRLPGNATRFDYQSIDPTRRRLYIAHLGDSTLDVVDLDTLRVVATVPKVADGWSKNPSPPLDSLP